jgi:cytidylate kinase
VVTIDGPAGAGKSTVARRLAVRLGYGFVSAGAIYRVVAWRVAAGIPLPEVLEHTQIEFRGEVAAQRVWVGGRDVTDELYEPAVGELASVLSQQAEVRAYADRLQRSHAETGPLVVEGRDAGTVVFPGADCKFYLDASLDARARRRLAEERGQDAGDLESVRSAIAARDWADRTRALAPLRRPPDARYVDSSDLSVEQVVELMALEVERVCSTGSCSR